MRIREFVGVVMGKVVEWLVCVQDDGVCMTQVATERSISDR